jgi:hypothetical protein
MSKRRIALPLAAILLLAVVLAPIPGSTRWIGALHDTAHAPIFGFVAILLLIAARRDARLGRMPPWTGYVLAFCASALLGVATELAQIPMGRDATLSDAGRDVLGAFAFLVMFAAFDPVLQGRAHAFSRRIVLALLTLPLLFVAVKPGVDAAAAYARRAAQFPVLADFSARFDDYFIQPNWSVLTIASPAQKYARVGERALHVRARAGLEQVHGSGPRRHESKFVATRVAAARARCGPHEPVRGPFQQSPARRTADASDAANCARGDSLGAARSCDGLAAHRRRAVLQNRCGVLDRRDLRDSNLA